MKKYLKYFLVIAIANIYMPEAISSDHGGEAPKSAHGGGGNGAGGSGQYGSQDDKKRADTYSTMSTADLEEMKQDQLLTYLSHPNYQSSEYAVFYFEQKGETSVPPLLKYLRRNSNDERIVSAIIYTLGRVGKNAKKAVPALLNFLDHDNPDIVKTTMAALGKIGKASEPAVPEIAKYLDDENEWARTLALRSLKDIGTEQSLAIAGQYEKKLALEQERKNRELMGHNVTAPASEAKPKQ